MVTGGFAHHTESWAMQRAKWHAKFVLPLRRISSRSSGGSGGMEFGLFGKIPSGKKIRNMVLVLVLILVSVGFILVNTLLPKGPSRGSIRKAARPLASSVMTGLNPGVKTTIPMFYISMAADQDRAAYMEYVYSGAGNSLTWIPAINGTDRDMLKSRLAMDHATLVEYDNFSAQRPHLFTYKHFKAVPGQIGNLLSHLDAIYTAYQNPAITVALVMEDDVGDLLTPHWPGKLEDLANLADAVDPEWAAIRLQWNDYDFLLDSIWSRWVSELHEWSAKVGGEAALVELHNIRRQTGRLPLDSKPPLIMPHASGWGNAATLFSRRGMDALIMQHFAGLDSDQVQDREDNGGNDGSLPRWNCPEAVPCVADLAFWPALEPHVFIATPPWFTYRIAEVQTQAIRKGQLRSNHKSVHLQSVARALQWIVSFDDALKPGGGLNVPWDTVWGVSQKNITS